MRALLSVCPSAAILLMIASICPGCGGRVFRHSGSLNMNGEMDVTGRMDMGDLETKVSLQTSNRQTPLKAVTVSGASAADSQKVAILDVDDFLVDRNIGGLGSMGENPIALFREKVEAVRNDPSVKAVVVRINSPGGGVTASDIMCHELSRLRAGRDLPIVASIMVVGTGGAYYLANHCDAIIAHPTSIVGGVGVILNTYNLQDTMGQFNILASPIKSGEKIDAGTPERPIADEEYAMLQRIADSFHRRFIESVQSKRPQLAGTADQWTDGSVMTGSEAQTLGLVDGVGYLDTAIEWAAGRAKLEDEPHVVIYRRENDPAYTPLDISPNQPSMTSLIPLRIPGLDRSSMPTFLYMWQADPSMAVLAQP